jgi:hypothetical protein
MLEAKKDNSKAILESTLIKLIGAIGFTISSLNFKHIVKAHCNTSKSNQWLLDWFKTQAITMGDKESTIILKIC